MFTVAWLGVLAGCGGQVVVDHERPVSQANPLDADEAALLDALNARRASAGLGLLVECPALNSSASLHVDDMRDQSYLTETAPDGSTVRSRACEAGYEPACNKSTAMGEALSRGLDDPAAIAEQLTASSITSVIVLNPDYQAVGVAHAEVASPPVWAIDLGAGPCE